MKLTWTLSHYIARHFVASVLLALGGLVALSTMIDVVELLRRASGRESVAFGMLLSMAALKAPYLATKMVPYAVLIGSMHALTRLTRTNELIIARAAGVSVWQFLLPAVVVALLLGVFMTAVFGPIASVLLLQQERLESKHLTGQSSLMAVSASGLWLRQVEENGEENIIHAQRISQNDMSLANVVIFSFAPNKTFAKRLDASRAVLNPGVLELSDVIRSLPGKPPEAAVHVSLPTSLTLSRIQDSFASPETMSFWSLPSFIDMLEEAGFSALKHRLYWQSLLSSPFLLAGMVLVAAVFSLRLPRHGKVGILIVAGIISGFLLHFFTDIVHALGSAGTLPVALAAWAPAGVVAMIGAALLLHLEDG